MGDEVDSVNYDEEDLEEEVDDESFPVSWSSLFLSLFRQCICVCSVIFLPYHIAVFPELTDLFVPLVREEDDFWFRATGRVTTLLGQSTFMTIVYSAMGAMFLHRNGRRFTILTCNISHLSLSTMSYYFYPRHRIGLLFGIWESLIDQFSFLTFHVYIAEMVGTSFRAFFLGLYSLVYAYGNYKAEEYQVKEWPIKPLILRGIVAAGCASFVSIFVPESPFWSASEGQTEEAEQVFYWMKAGSLDTSDEVELNLLLDVAQERAEEGVKKKILSRSFAIYCVYVILIYVGAINPCEVQRLVMSEFIFEKKYSVKATDYSSEYFDVFNKAISHFQLIIHGGLLFLALSFLIPRKFLFVMSLVSGTLLVIPVLMKVEDASGLARIGLYCSLIAHAGMIPLTYIIPTEIFPATSREFGLVAAVSFGLLKKRMSRFYSRRMAYYLGEVEPIQDVAIYFSYAVSIVGIPVIMVFMPETKGISMYDLRDE